MSAVSDADVGGHVQIVNGLLHLGHAVAEVEAFEARGHDYIALQIFAADFGLPGNLR